jgi:hypothetical protein
LCVKKKTTQSYFKFINLFHFTLRLLLRIFLLNRKHFKYNVKNNKKTFLTLSPKILTIFIKKQLTLTSSLNMISNVFTKSLNQNFFNLFQIILRIFNYRIIGFKFVCVGKWIKTTTGRKNIIYLKYGIIQSSDITNKILYQNIAQKTRFGMCCIKL